MVVPHFKKEGILKLLLKKTMDGNALTYWLMLKIDCIWFIILWMLQSYLGKNLFIIWILLNDISCQWGLIFIIIIWTTSQHISGAKTLQIWYHCMPYPIAYFSTGTRLWDLAKIWKANDQDDVQVSLIFLFVQVGPSVQWSKFRSIDKIPSRYEDHGHPILTFFSEGKGISCPKVSCKDYSSEANHINSLDHWTVTPIKQAEKWKPQANCVSYMAIIANRVRFCCFFGM